MSRFNCDICGKSATRVISDMLKCDYHAENLRQTVSNPYGLDEPEFEDEPIDYGYADAYLPRWKDFE